MEDTVHITGVSFSVLTPEDVLGMAVCEVSSSVAYQHHEAKHAGINDPRLGTVNESNTCMTCHNDMVECPGHSGFLRLAVPVFHYAHVPRLVKILSVVCPCCLSVSPSSRAGKRVCRMEACAIPLPKYRARGSWITRDWSPEGVERLGSLVQAGEIDEGWRESLLAESCAESVFVLLQGVDVEELKKAGVVGEQSEHPRNYMLPLLLVPPLCFRPSVIFGHSTRTRGQDDLTVRLQEIMRCNNRIARARAGGVPTSGLEETLSMCIGSYMNRDCNPKHTGRQRGNRRGNEKCIMDRLKGKRGRIRGCLMGKRVNFCARSVISPGCKIAVDEIGVPAIIARKLTFKERVTEINLGKMRACVAAGHLQLRGARSVTNLRGENCLVEYGGNPEVLARSLRPGCVVERYMRDGDWVLVNRQPTLRKKSMMTHRVVVVPGKTILLNLSTAHPYNADFDGDEMNLHFPQTHEAVSDARELMSVGSQLLNAQDSRPVMGLVQDSLLAAFLLTSLGAFFDMETTMQLSASIDGVGGLPPRRFCARFRCGPASRCFPSFSRTSTSRRREEEEGRCTGTTRRS